MATNEQTDGILLDLLRYIFNITAIIGGLLLLGGMLYILIERAHPKPEIPEEGVTVAQVAPTPATEPAAEGTGSEAAPAESETVPAMALDPERVAKGAELFISQGCGGCHTIEGVDGAVGAVGPNLTQIGVVAEERAKEVGVEDAAAYIRQSIVDPNAYIVPECPTGPCVQGMMPATFGQTLSEEEIEALVQFLLSQKGGS